MSSFTGETKSSSIPGNSSTPTFYTNKLPPSTNLPNDIFKKSADLTKKGTERNKYNHFTGTKGTGANCLHELCKSYKLSMCQDCRATLPPERVVKEEQEAKRIKNEDLLSVLRMVAIRTLLY